MTRSYTGLLTGENPADYGLTRPGHDAPIEVPHFVQPPEFPAWVNQVHTRGIDFNNPSVNLGGEKVDPNITTELTIPPEQILATNDLQQARWDLSVAERRSAEALASGRIRIFGLNILKTLGLRNGPESPTVRKTQIALRKATNRYQQASDKYSQAFWLKSVSYSKNPTLVISETAAAVASSISEQANNLRRESLAEKSQKHRPKLTERWQSLKDKTAPTRAAFGNLANGAITTAKIGAEASRGFVKENGGLIRRVVGATAAAATLSLPTASIVRTEHVQSEIVHNTTPKPPVVDSKPIGTTTTTIQPENNNNQDPEAKTEKKVFTYDVRPGDGVTHMLQANAESYGFQLTPRELEQVNDFLMDKFGARIFDLHTRASGAIYPGNGQVYFNIGSQVTLNPKINDRLPAVYAMMIDARN